jgi:hypothetical protein
VELRRARVNLRFSRVDFGNLGVGFGRRFALGLAHLLDCVLLPLARALGTAPLASVLVDCVFLCHGG